MPQRFLRPGITTSNAWNACGWKAQSLYIRLITLVDDYGRYDGRIAIIHGHCFPLRSDIKPQETAALVGELSANNLIELYEVEHKEYLQMLKWQERTRGKSKYPDPKDGQILRIPADSCGIPQIPASIVLSHKPSPLHHPADDGFDEFWKAYPRKLGKGDALKAWKKLSPSDDFRSEILSAVVAQSKWPDWIKEGGQFIPHPATWLNGCRWEDELPEKPKSTPGVGTGIFAPGGEMEIDWSKP